MSASTVSITANPAAPSRRRPVLADKKTSSIELLPAEPPQANGGDANAKDLSHHSIRGEAAKDLLQLKRAAATSTVSPRRTRKASAGKLEKTRWLTVVSVFTKNLVLLLVLIGLIQVVRKLALKSRDLGDYSSGFAEFEGRIAEFESSFKKTANMIQLQMEVMDKKIVNEVDGLRRKTGERIDEKGAVFAAELKNFGGRIDGLEKVVEELTAENWLSKDEFERFYEEFRKRKGGEIGESDVSLDDVRAYAREIVMKEIEKHAADGLGKPDYALASSGGMVVKHSESVRIKPFGGKVSPWSWSKVNPEAEKMLKPSFGETGQCFPLKGSSGFVEIRLRTAIIPEAVTLEHIAKSVAFDRSTAPKDCRVSGWLQGKDFGSSVTPEKMFLLTEFTYDLEKSSAQTFDVLKSAASHVIDTVRLDVTSNHGNPSHTCIYRLRVHGYEPDSVSLMSVQNSLP